MALAPEKWTWSVVTEKAGAGRIYVCRSPSKDDEVFLQVSSPGPLSESAEVAIGAFLRGIRSSVRARGLELDKLELDKEEWKPFGAPGPGSIRLTARISSHAGASYLTAYLYASDRLYIIYAFAPTTDESAALQFVLRSFHLLSSPPEPEERAPILGMFVLGLLLFILLGSWVVNFLANKPLLNGGLIGAVLVAFLLVARIIMLLVRSAGPESFGYAVGEFGIPLAIAGLAALHFARQKRRRVSGPTESSGR